MAGFPGKSQDQDSSDRLRSFLAAQGTSLGISGFGECWRRAFSVGPRQPLVNFPCASDVATELLRTGARLRHCAVVCDAEAGVAHCVPTAPGFPKVNFVAWAARNPWVLVGADLFAQISSSNHSDNIIGEALGRYRAHESRAVQVISSVLTPSEKALADRWAIPYSSSPVGRVPHVM
ncbi:hypothetical protein C4U21_20810, partial [Clostridioides difficile]